MTGGLLACTRCELIATCRKPVQGGGSRNTPIMVIGEAPGFEEDLRGKPFLGKAGMDLNYYLYTYAGVRRDSVYVTNVVKCRPPNNIDPTAFQISRCSKWLDAELDRIKPEIIVTVGRFAARVFKKDIRLEAEHGIPFDIKRGGHTATVVPCYHTALGLHDIRKTTSIIEDFKVLGTVIAELEIEAFTDCAVPYPQNRDEHLGRERYEALRDGITERLWNHTLSGEPLIIGLDTEWCVDESLWSIQISTRPGEAAVIFPSNEIGMKDLRGLMQRDNVQVIVHNANADIPQLVRAGLGTPKVFHDSMLAADIIQKEPKGLKALAMRFAGMKMRDYMGIIAPAQRKMSVEYLKVLFDYDLPKPKMSLIWEYKKESKCMVPRFRVPWSMERKINRILDDIDEGKEVDPLKRWNDIAEEDGRGAVELMAGPMPRSDLRHADPESALKYAARDADATLRVWPYLCDLLTEYDLWSTYNCDMQALQLVLRMENYGMRVKVEHYKKLGVRFTQTMDEAGRDISNMAGEHINPASPVQVANLIYRKLGLPQPRQVRDEDSTNSDHLKPLRTLHPVIPKILEYREYKKLITSFCRPIVASAEGSTEGDRVRSSLRVSGADTGRMTSRRPNLMNQPSRSETGRLIREGFIAPEGMVLVHSDFGKMDFTIMAHCSGDERMCRIMWDFWNETDPDLKKEKDLHAITAQMLFGVAPKDQDKYIHRLPAKTVGFGVAFGLGPSGLQGLLLKTASELEEGPAKTDLLAYENVTRCEDLIKEWFKGFSGVRTFFDTVIERTRDLGYARDCFGRIRHIGAINSIHNNIRTEAERQACNAVIQGGTAGAIKRAMGDMLEVCDLFIGMGYRVEPWMQIHDALLFAVDKECARDFSRLLTYAMTNCIKLKVPVIADVEMGEDWAGLTDDEDKWKPILEEETEEEL